MNRQPLLAACFLAAAVCLAPLGRSAELVTLRNGFQMQCDHHAATGGSIRVYLTSGNDDYIEFLPSQIASVSRVATPTVPPQNSFGALPSAVIQPALTPADLRQMLAHAGRSHNLDADLLASVVHAESGNDPRAVSRAGARGLMQLMPATAAALGVRNSFQPQQNVGGGSAYLDGLLTRYSDNLALALAAYNAGPQAVDRYHGVPPYPETRAYVARVIHEFNRRVLARRAAAARPLPHKLQAAVSQK